MADIWFLVVVILFAVIIIMAKAVQWIIRPISPLRDRYMDPDYKMLYMENPNVNTDYNIKDWTGVNRPDWWNEDPDLDKESNQPIGDINNQQK